MAKHNKERSSGVRQRSISPKRAAAEHDQRIVLLADMIRRLASTEARDRAARVLARLEGDPEAIQAVVDLLAEVAQ
jgi:hypothetical protein